MTADEKTLPPLPSPADALRRLRTMFGSTHWQKGMMHADKNGKHCYCLVGGLRHVVLAERLDARFSQDDRLSRRYGWTTSQAAEFFRHGAPSPAAGTPYEISAYAAVARLLHKAVVSHNIVFLSVPDDVAGLENGLIIFNDSPDTRLEDVLRVLDEAIASAER